MSYIVEFLKARLDEDERDKQHIVPPTLWQRWLAGIEAKRRIVAEYEDLLRVRLRHEAALAELNADVDAEEKTGKWSGVGSPDVRSRALRREADYLDAMLPVIEGLIKSSAEVFADHEGYRQEWKP
jgi:hypothetical protein